MPEKETKSVYGIAVSVCVLSSAQPFSPFTAFSASILFSYSMKQKPSVSSMSERLGMHTPPSGILP